MELESLLRFCFLALSSRPMAFTYLFLRELECNWTAERQRNETSTVV